jgi:hypothetical protein
MEYWSLLKSFYEGVWRKEENNGEDEPKWYTIDVYMKMTQ